MTTNQEGRQAAIRESTGTTWAINGDWHALWDAEGIDAGSWDQRMLAWLNAELGASHTNLTGAMHAYAAANGYSRWTDIGTFSLSGASSLLSGEDQGLAFDFTDQSARIKDTGTPANAYNSTGTVSSGALVGPGGKLTYTSPSNKLVMQSTGYITYSAHNLILQSEDFTTSWTNVQTSDSANTQVAPDGTTSADTITSTAASGVCYISQTPTANGAAIHKFSVRFKAGTSPYICMQTLGRTPTDDNADSMFIDTSDGSITLALGSSVASGTVTSLGDGWYLAEMLTSEYPSSTQIECRVTLTDVSTSETSVSNNGATVHLWGAHLHRYPAVTDYIKTTSAAVYSLPYEYDTSGACKGLLVEEARTNLALYSTQLNTSGTWAQQDSVVVTANQSIGPTGLTDLDEIGVAGAGAGFPRIVQTVSTSGTCTYSVYVKDNTCGTIELAISGTGLGGGADTASFYTFTFSTASFAKRSGATATSTFVEDLTSVISGLYRIGITMASTTITDIRLYPSWGDASAQSFYAGYVQLEQGSFPTSPIITYSAAATRAADNISIATSAFPYVADGSTWFVEVDDYDGGSNTRLMSVYGADRLLDIYRANSTTLAWFSNNTNLGFTSFSTSFDTEASSVNKIAVRLANNDSANYYNGSQITNDTSCTIDAVSTTLGIGQYSGAAFGSFNIRKMYFVPRGKSDSELQTETT